MDERFYNYLLDKGFNVKGAHEVIRRIKEDRADRIDVYEIRSFESEAGWSAGSLEMALRELAVS